MAYARQFENDIFISYAHVDNEDPMGVGWVKLFRDCLEARLKQLIGDRTGTRALAIWRDKKLDGNERFAEVLVDEVRKAALMVSVLSPSYVSSDWCRKEIQTFCDAAGGERGLYVSANKARVIKVLKDEVPRDRHPEVLQAGLGYEFYVKDKETKRPLPFTLTRGDDTEAMAKRVIDDLARTILETLEAINAEGAAPAVGVPAAVTPAAPAVAAATATATAAKADSGAVVYLAETEYELDPMRQQLRRELADRGITVLPAGDLPLRGPQVFEAAVRDDLARSQLSVHLVGATRATIPGGCKDDVVVLQDRYAAERAGAGLRRLVWLPPDLAVADDQPDHKAFVEKLERAPLAAEATEVVRAPLHALLEQIHVTLERQRRAAEAPPPRAPGDEAIPAIYVISHPVDEALSQAVEGQLFGDGETCNILPSARDGNDEERVALHRSNMANCDAVLIVLGAASVAWKDAQLAEAIKAAQARGGRKVPVRVYLGPPVAEIKPLRMAGVQQIDGRAGIAADALADLLVAARRAIADAGKAA